MTPIERCRTIVFARQGGECIARIVDPEADACRNRYGCMWAPSDGLELDRIRDFPMMGKSVSHADPKRCCGVCSWHHRGGTGGSTWATMKVNRKLVREYLALVAA